MMGDTTRWHRMMDDVVRIVIFADSDGEKHSTNIEAEAKIRGLQVDIRRIDGNMTGIETYLQAQPMGTRVVVCATRSNIQQLRPRFVDAGYGNEEVFFYPAGEGHSRVFCVGCYGINDPTTEATNVCCHCGRQLAVSTHYSIRHDAVFGSLTVPEQRVPTSEVTRIANSEDFACESIKH